MNYNLNLLVCKERQLPQNGLVRPHTQLEMGRDYSVFGQIVELPDLRGQEKAGITGKPTITTHVLPECLKVFVPEAGKFTRDNAHRQPMTWAHAGDLAAIDLSPPPTQEASTDCSNFEINFAVKAYLGALPDKSPVIIYLH